MEKSNKALRSEMAENNKALRSDMEKSIRSLRSDMEKSIRSLRSEMAENNETLRLEMKRDNRDLRKDLTREIRDLRLRVHDNLTILVQLFVAVIAMISGLIGYIVWDRRTALQPVRDQQFKLQQELKELKEGLDRDLERRHPAGSLPDRLVKALQLHARGDQSLTSTLRSFSLL